MKSRIITLIKRVKKSIQRKSTKLPIYRNNLYFGAKFKITCEIEKHRILNYGGEKEALDYFLKLSENSNVIYDIGASVGLFSIIAAKKNPKSIIYSFEPDPETLLRLNENIQLNKLKNISSLNVACSDKESNVELFTDGVNGFAPSLAKQVERKGAPKNSVIIKSNKLDNIIFTNELKVPDLIKIDIEGAEILCIKGSERLLKGDLGKKPKDIFIELHPVFLKDFNSTVDEVSDLLLNAGYKKVWEKGRDEQIHTHYQLNEK